MFSAWLLAASLTGTLPDMLLADAIENFRRIDTYRVTIRSLHADGEETIRYHYRKPGFVRMEFIRPHEGAVLIYSPLTRRVNLWPFGVGHFPRFNLSPGNPLIQSPHGQRVDRSDVGTLFENVRALQAKGTTEIAEEENPGGRPRLHLVVTGDGGSAIGDVHRYDLWLDAESLFPVKVISRDRHDVLIETVIMEAPEINVPLPDALFDAE